MTKIAIAKGRFIPVTARKIRSVVRLIRGRDVAAAQAILENLPKGACEPIAKVLNSAVANAKRQGTWTSEQLFISKVLADGGPSARRFRAAPMGRASMFKRRMCHLTIELDVKKESN